MQIRRYSLVCSERGKMMLQGKSVLRRTFVMLLVMLVFAASPAYNLGKARAAAEASAALHSSVVQEFIAAILARSGVEFKSGGSLLSVAAMVYDDLKNVDQGEMQQSIDDFMESLNPTHWNVDWNYAEQLANQMAIRVSPGVWQAICDSFNRLRAASVDYIVSSWTVFEVVNEYKLFTVYAPLIKLDGHFYCIRQESDSDGNYLAWYCDDVLVTRGVNIYPDADVSLEITYCPADKYMGITYRHPNGGFTGSSVKCYLDFIPSLVSVPSGFYNYSGSLAYPPDDTLVRVPDLPTVGADGAISMPDIPVLPEDYVVSDLPDTAGKVIPDLPYDVPIDIATGDSVVSKDIPDIPDIPADTTLSDIAAKLTDAIAIAGGIADTLTGALSVPSDQDVAESVDDMKLPKSWIQKFPFCLPFDALRIVKQLKVEPIEPVIVVPMKYGNLVDETLTLDLTDYKPLFSAIKFLEYVVFLIGLTVVTRQFIKW